MFETCVNCPYWGIVINPFLGIFICIYIYPFLFLNSPILVYTYVGYVLTKAHMID